MATPLQCRKALENLATKLKQVARRIKNGSSKARHLPPVKRAGSGAPISPAGRDPNIASARSASRS